MKIIVLSKGQIATVDDADFERVNQFKWYAKKFRRNCYAARWIKGKEEFLHWFILGAKGVDHKNGDGLDNRSENLRFATKSQNGGAFQRKRAICSSQYRGVHWNKDKRKWEAQIRIRGRQIHLGTFDAGADAAMAYDAAAHKHFGEFASPNFQ